MSDGDMVEAVARAIEETGLLMGGPAIDAAEAALSVIEGRVRAEERERAARIADDYADNQLEAREAIDRLGYPTFLVDAALMLAASIAAAIRNGEG